MRDDETDDPRDDSLIAAEFVLGLLDADDHEAAVRRRESDAPFARLVEDWELHLGPMAAEIPAVQAPADTWSAIESRFGWKDAPTPRAGLWNSLAFWRGLGIGSSVVAAASLAAVMVLQAPKPMPGNGMVAVLAGDDGQSAYTATLDHGGRITLIPVAETAPPPDRVWELWVIGPDGRPSSLGTFSASRPMMMPMPDAMMPMRGEVAMAVSLEPDGGSPTGQPTGPVVAKGMIRNL